MSTVYLSEIAKQFGSVTAVRDLNLTIQEGEFFTFVGASGCGKTTTVRMIAGFYYPTTGKVKFNDRDMTKVAPEKRETGMVFQNYALFPHMTVFDNVAYGLNLLKLTKQKIKERVDEALTQVQLDGYGGRKPSELSGGQQQRVAIARCLVLRPKVLLLDEPLSNLDANLRMIMRDEIRRLKEELNLTIIFVTHDQEEALSISDRVMVLKDGSLQQLDRPEEVYQRPANEFIANFVGTANLLAGEVQEKNDESYFVTEDIQFAIESNDNKKGLALIRPEMIQPFDGGALEGVVLNKVYHGNSIRYKVKVDQTTLLIDDYNIVNKKTYEAGEKIRLDIPKNLHLIEA